VSCIAGLFDRAGAPVEPPLLTRMLESMKSRAPDGSEVRCEGALGFGLAYLRTGTSGSEKQHPISMDGEVWLAADARIDGRADLIRRLRAAGRQVADDASHAELILHAYHVFGDNFLDHLLGDFALALWDGRTRRLLCARDPFGVRPFYYFQAGSLFGFASDIDALLAHPLVSRELDDASVMDFLLFGTDQDPDRTIYREVRCLPPATRLDITRDAVTLRTYWQLQRHTETRCGSHAEYVERFTALFEQAVTDRLPAGPVAFQLSGGMDSTAIAAVAASRPDAAARRTIAYTVSAQSLVPDDDELYYAQVAASHLGIPLLCQDLGHYGLFERSQDPALRTAWPLAYPHLAAYRDALDRMGEVGARILLSGHGGDSVMAPSASYYPQLLRARRFGKLAKEIWHHARHTGTLAGMGLRSALLPTAPEPPWSPPMPDWISPVLAARAGPPELRWQRGWETLHNAVDAHQQLTQPWLSRNFQAQEILKVPVVARYPFYDLRLVEFLLGLPNFMLRGKLVLRQSMKGQLPESITARKKTSMRGDLVRVIVTKRKSTLLAELKSVLPPEIDAQGYEHALDRYCAGDGEGTTWASLAMLSSLAFGHWVNSRKRD